MFCREFHLELERAIERRQTPSAATVAHFSGCDEESCRSRWREYLLIEEAIALWASGPAAEATEIDLTPGVLARFRAPLLSREMSGETNAARRSSGAGLISAVAATVTVACVLFAITLRTGPVETSPRSADRLDETASGTGRMVASNLASPLEADDPLQRLGMVSASWMQGATARVSDTVAFILPVDEPVGTGEEAPGWFGLFEDLPPLEEQFQRTLRTLFDAEDAGTG